jgi:hypothetical protein
MKTKQTLLALGLFAALQAVAADQSTNGIATATFTKAQIQPSYPANEYKLETKKTVAVDRSKIERYEGLSSQAWTTIATRRSDFPVARDARTHESKIVVCYFGHEPW